MCLFVAIFPVEPTVHPHYGARMRVFWSLLSQTFNEWMESTQIEPSTAWGDQYLQMTKQNADLFRASLS